MSCGAWVAAGLAALVLGVGADAPAHNRSVSYATWELEDAGARVRARISRLDLTRLALDPVASQADSAAAARLLAGTLQLFAGGEPCAATGAPIRLPASPGWVVFSWTVACNGDRNRHVVSTLLHDVAPSHLHFARVVRGEAVVERVLTAASPAWELAGEPDDGEAAVVGTGFADYLFLGVEHILSGWDHLAFVVALLLLAATLGEVAALVTGFTIAHSVTLGLAVLGVVQPDMGVVEALIGFSIALVASENAWLLAGRGAAIPFSVVLGLAALAATGAGRVPQVATAGLALFAACHFALLRISERPARLRSAVAFAFGLIHGFGFAGVLATMSLPAGRLVPALFGFNLGVEVGQLAVVMVVWPLLRFLARRLGAPVERWLAEAVSAGIFGLGLYWFVVRTSVR